MHDWNVAFCYTLKLKNMYFEIDLLAKVDIFILELGIDNKMDEMVIFKNLNIHII